jgi:hypothetical protein
MTSGPPAHLLAAARAVAQEVYDQGRVAGRSALLDQVVAATQAVVPPATPQPPQKSRRFRPGARLAAVRRALARRMLFLGAAGLSQRHVGAAAWGEGWRGKASSLQVMGSHVEAGARPHAAYRRALLRLLRARRWWRGHRLEAQVWWAARALLQVGDPVLAFWLLEARPERLRDVLWGVTVHALLRHPVATENGEPRRPGDRVAAALEVIEDGLGPFRGGVEGDIIDALCGQGPHGRDGVFVWSPEPGWLRAAG